MGPGLLRTAGNSPASFVVGCRVRLSQRSTKSSKTGSQRNLRRLRHRSHGVQRTVCVHVSRVGFGSSQRPEHVSELSTVTSQPCQLRRRRFLKWEREEKKKYIPVRTPSALSCLSVVERIQCFPVKISCNVKSARCRNVPLLPFPLAPPFSKEHLVIRSAEAIKSLRTSIWRTEPSQPTVQLGRGN